MTLWSMNYYFLANYYYIIQPNHSIKIALGLSKYLRKNSLIDWRLHLHQITLWYHTQWSTVCNCIISVFFCCFYLFVPVLNFGYSMFMHVTFLTQFDRWQQLWLIYLEHKLTKLLDISGLKFYTVLIVWINKIQTWLVRCLF